MVLSTLICKMTKKLLIRVSVALAILLFLMVCVWWAKSTQLSSLQKRYELSLKLNKDFRKETNRLGEVVYSQQQNIISSNEAKKLLSKEVEKWKSVKSKVEIITKTKIDTVFIPFTDTLYLTDTIYPKGMISVPKRFKLDTVDFKIHGIVLLDGVKIDSIVIPNKLSVTIGKIKPKWYKKAQNVVSIKNSNKLLSITDINNFITEDKPKFYQRNVFWLSLGAIIGSSTILILR